MEIKYFGHSCFRLKGKKATVIIDPYSDEIGLKMPKLTAEIVVVSHSHFDHNNVAVVKGTPKREQPFLVEGPGEYEISGVGMIGISSFHDAVKGQERGKNTIFVLKMDGLTIVHLGDLGETISDDKAEEIGPVDVLFVPVGGEVTIGPKEAAAVVNKLEPRIVIPMHFLAPGLTSSMAKGLRPVEEFLHEMGVSGVESVETLEVAAERLPEGTQVYLLKTTV